MAAKRERPIEVTFTVEGHDYTRRPTFDIIAKLEEQFAIFPRLIRSIIGGEYGMRDVAGMMHVMLGEDGPGLEVVQRAVLAMGYAAAVNKISEMLGIVMDGAKITTPVGDFTVASADG